MISTVGYTFKNMWVVSWTLNCKVAVSLKEQKQ